MSSFVKTSSIRNSINGTKLKNNLPYISSGIPSLDFVIGGGVPAGSIFTIEEDVLGSYSRVLSKYFLAEGVVCKHDLFIASADEDPKMIVQELPQPCATQSHEDKKQVAEGEMKIAWRYESLGQIESSFGSNTNFGHHFDLSKTVEAQTISDCNITFCHLTQELSEVKVFKNPMYHQLLSSIKKVISKEDYMAGNKNNNILRIVIQSLGSPVWFAKECDEDVIDNSYGTDILKFMYCLRALLRDTLAVALVTLPSHLFDDEHLMKRLQYSIDNAVRLESFAGSSKETNPVYNEYHGLFHIEKLSAVHCLVPYVPPSLDLAFKLKRKKFVIEKLHLPPELQESSEREQDDITATPKTTTCGGFKKKDIDF
ncbi:elongator complex protein 4 [Aricia agestis]|uniref:elongator complex protein 4 n=1 Tax=Aricia agestis TaxID=91739 RepID=UPI001C209635|nr:elongator complex protein 4 [Aricia agestis]